MEAAPLRKLVAGNWKMNGLKADGLALARALVARAAAGDPPDCTLAVCPPATLLIPIGDTLRGSGIALGAQDCDAEPKGAHTGDISAAMLKDAGCIYVIVGHSERRADHGEADAVVRAKASAAHAAGLLPILCVGETLTERDAGETLAVVKRQIEASVPEGLKAGQIVIAYEPVWAIGTGRTATAVQVAEVHAHLRSLLRVRVKDAAEVPILYGGSVKPGNALELLSVANVDGALVGGASLDAADFWAIAQACP
ncbi:MAG TPA: triose-phosphate isomerase [Stellaceae bacterium]|nr:triose-phosphate isomerase [Stellaceae bacterium]